MIKNYINHRCYCIDVIVIKSNKKDFCYKTLIKQIFVNYNIDVLTIYLLVVNKE
jgi:hypothetical protein